MTNLEKLDIQRNPCTEGGVDGLLKVLQQLSYSNVSKLNIKDTGYCKLLHVTDHYSIMTQLIDPSSGKLKELDAGDFHSDSYECQLILELMFSFQVLRPTPV